MALSQESEAEGVVVDFGLSQEFMRPLRRITDLGTDPLISVAGALADLEEGELGLLQVLSAPTRHPWGDHALHAVTDWEGKPFFLDAPEMVPLAREKVTRPFFATVLRVEAKSGSIAQTWEILRGLGGALRQFAHLPSNELIPLSNEEYPDEDHEEDLLERQSRRSGMLLNVEELVSLVHPPSAAVQVEKLARERKRSKTAPAAAQGHASDLVAVFRRLSTSRGDQMTSILGNAVLAILESSEGGTLVDLRRLLVDPASVGPTSRRQPRGRLLLGEGVPAPQVLARGAALDAAGRVPTAQADPLRRRPEGGRLDLAAAMAGGKILLAKLAHGQIGQENAYLLGSLLVSKLYQLAMARQGLAESERRPFHVVIDEFHHFITPSMAGVLRRSIVHTSHEPA